MIYLEKKLLRLRNLLNLNSNSECSSCQKQITIDNKYEFIFQNSDNHDIKNFYKIFFDMYYKSYTVYYDEKEINRVSYIFQPNISSYVYFRNHFLIGNILPLEITSFSLYFKEFLKNNLYFTINSITDKISLKTYSLNTGTKLDPKITYIQNPYYNSNIDTAQIEIEMVNDLINPTKNNYNFKTTQLDESILQKLKINDKMITIKQDSYDLSLYKNTKNENEILPPAGLVYSSFIDYYNSQPKKSILCNDCSGKIELRKAEKTYNSSLDKY